jgi:3-oxosteroid 1-dehydrogenase
MPDGWDRVADVVVLGSGAAGLAAATMASDGGAEVLVVEKADMIGGTSGVSGGMPWIPMNRHMAEIGIDDSRDEAIAYIRRLALGREPDPALVEVYVDTATEMLDYFEEHTPLAMSAPPMFSDYYADQVGGKRAGRSIEPAPFNAREELGDWAPKLRTSAIMPRLTMEEGGRFLAYGEAPDMEMAAKREADDIRVVGAALVAALFKGILDRGVDVMLETAAKELVVVDGAVVGVRASNAAGEPVLIGARKAVVLACGGFEWNTDMVAAFVGDRLEPLSPRTNEGDGHIMAMEAGAQLGLMWSHWGQPAMADPTLADEHGPLLQFSTGRNLAGSIMVNRHGRRFVNEGVSYQDLPKTIGTYDPVAIDYPNEGPLWMIFDHQLKESTVIMSIYPGVPAPEWVDQAPTITELAGRIGVDPDTLQATVERFNGHAATGVDPDFGRGTVWWEAFMAGGPSPDTCLRPLTAPPFYALPIHNGTLGTQGGARIDASARVLSYRDGVIPGLYAAGNVSACVFGAAYPGGGATLGPALTFGYIAGRHAATQPTRL